MDTTATRPKNVKNCQCTATCSQPRSRYDIAGMQRRACSTTREERVRRTSYTSSAVVFLVSCLSQILPHRQTSPQARLLGPQTHPPQLPPLLRPTRCPHRHVVAASNRLSSQPFLVPSSEVSGVFFYLKSRFSDSVGHGVAYINAECITGHFRVGGCVQVRVPRACVRARVC